MKAKFNSLISIVLILVLIQFSLISCTRKTSPEAGTEPRNTQILATFYPLYIILMNLTQGVEGVEISMLAPANTGCLHDYQLTTKDMKSLEKCSILVANGSGMEDFLEKALEIKSDCTIIASEGFPLADDNAHVWVSPGGAIHETKKITEGLCSLDPANSEKYTENCSRYVRSLEELSEYMHGELKVFEGSEIITFHEAFPYFSKEFRFNTISTIEREAGEDPSAKELAELIETISTFKQQGKTPGLFAEPQYSSSAAEVIASETGIKLGNLDPCVTGELKADAYIEAMKKNTLVIKEALSGSR